MPIPKGPEIEEVYGQFATFSKLELWYNDVPYEIQPLSTISLKVITWPEYGSGTCGVWAPECKHTWKALPFFIVVLHKLKAPMLPAPIASSSIQAESDAIVDSMFHRISDSAGLRVRFRSESGFVAFRDSRLRRGPHRDIRLLASKAACTKGNSSRGISKVSKERQIELWKRQGFKLLRDPST
ncbi:hypothetical protein PAXINDRAFT_158874 [Paxillus involutus ATCC 200175]|uniref:Unplaced genomic scaffold PAXINscaffold_1247, whole genome shotgun sequence n=1 Tax=Paxillus involutus ATCC 200175 TaxID=664439 RepID=A0A0C9SUB9_PAXIN|nr:hypothetical protein PAXINDRAFT_158874 [Paxillus involutus ATCC 200175]